MRTLSKFVALGAVAAATSTLAFATEITPGGPTVAADPTLSATNTGTLNSVTGTLTARTFTGDYQVIVFTDAANPYGAGDLTFAITLYNNMTSPNGIEHVSLGDDKNTFGQFSSVNVGYGNNGLAYGNDAPVTVDETIYGTVEFNFPGSSAIAHGTGTQYLLIQTPATNYTFGNLGVIDSSTDTETGFVPAASTPEPSSLMLLGTGLFGGAATLLRRRRNALSL